jgi:hypothetical protein
MLLNPSKQDLYVRHAQCLLDRAKIKRDAAVRKRDLLKAETDKAVKEWEEEVRIAQSKGEEADPSPERPVAWQDQDDTNTAALIAENKVKEAEIQLELAKLDGS